MDTLHENVRSVSGVFFQISGVTAYCQEPKKITYMLYLKKGKSYAALYKFIRMLAIPFRMVLIDECDMEQIGFVLMDDGEEKEELESIMEWIVRVHPEWIVINCQEATSIPTIIGYRIANNLFHAKKLVLQGEILE